MVIDDTDFPDRFRGPLGAHNDVGLVLFMQAPRQVYEVLISGGELVRVVKGHPSCSWDHVTHHWHCPKLADAVLDRREHDLLLGHLTGNSFQTRDHRRQFLSPAEIPWLNGHRVQNQSVFPAVGYVSISLWGHRRR